MTYNIFSPNCVGGYTYRELKQEFSVPFIWHILREQDYKNFFENLPSLDFSKLNSICLMSKCQKTFKGEMCNTANPFVCLNVSSQNIPLYFIHHQYKNIDTVEKHDDECCVCLKDIQKYVLDKYIDRKNRFDVQNKNIIILSHAISGITLSDETLIWYSKLKTLCEKILIVHSSKFDHTIKFFNDTDVTVLTTNSVYISDAAKHVAAYLKQHEKQQLNPDVIVSLATYKERILNRNLVKVLDSILFQKTSLNIKIVVTVYQDDFQYFNNEQLNYFKNYNIEIIQAPENLRPHLKYYYCDKKHKNVPIITIDDDAIYNEILVEKLYQSYKENPECISACGCKYISIKDNNICKYSTYQIANSLEISHKLLAIGVTGCLYPPNLLHFSEIKPDYIKNSCLTANDIFLKYLELKYDIKVKNINISNSCRPIMSDATDSTALYLHENKSNNDIYIQKFLTPFIDVLKT